jgi:hypothetical protein
MSCELVLLDAARCDGTQSRLTRSARLSRWLMAVGVAGLLGLSAGCVGSGKVARLSSIEPLPPSVPIVADATTGCREGESGFDYRFVVVGTNDLSPGGPLLSTLRLRGFYHSVGASEDLSWMAVSYQHHDVALRAEIGPLVDYLARPRAHEGPDPASLPPDVVSHAVNYSLIALRPTDFLCSTPL